LCVDTSVFFLLPSEAEVLLVMLVIPLGLFYRHLLLA